MKYIDADRLRAEINRLYQEHSCRDYCDEACSVLDRLDDFIDSIQQEQPEVDLKKEIDRELDTRWKGEYLSTQKFRESARHFFVLGLKARKEE